MKSCFTYAANAAGEVIPYWLRTRGVHGNGEDWDPMGIAGWENMGMGFKFQMGMGMQSLKWEGIGTKILFPHTSTPYSIRRPN